MSLAPKVRVFYEDDSDKSVYYGNRCECYLKLASNDLTDALTNALMDAKLSVRSNPNWWKAYFRLGKVHECRSELHRADEEYNFASALNPTNETIKTRLSNVRCKRIELERNPPAMSYEERLHEAHVSFAERGVNLSPQLVEITKTFAERILPGQKEVFMGHEYRDGSKRFAKDLVKAIEYYESGIKLGNAEAMYNLAFIYFRGVGTNVELAKGHKLLLRAAAQSPFVVIAGQKQNRVGVAEAEYVLGLHYQEGIYVDKNEVTAVFWYERAIAHGSGTAANNLGVMFFRGDSVNRDLCRAEDLFLLAWKRNETKAAANLIELYMISVKPTEVNVWHGIYVKYTHDVDQGLVRRVKEFVNRTEVVKEVGDALPLFSRMRREMFERNGTVPAVTREKAGKFDLEQLGQWAANGSTYAKRLYETKKVYDEALRNMDSLSRTAFIEQIFNAIANDGFVCSTSMCQSDQIISNLANWIEEMSSSHSALDEKAMLCLLHFKGLVSMKDGILLADMYLKKYPTSSVLLNMRGCLHCFQKQVELGLMDLQQAVILHPQNDQYHYDFAVALRLKNRVEEAIRAYEQFLQMAPKDHRKVPAAYYAISVLWLCKTDMTDIKKVNMQMMMTHWTKGQEAEKYQLACFLPYDDTCKSTLQMVISSLDSYSGEPNMDEPKQLDKLIDSCFVQPSKSFLFSQNRADVLRKHREMFKTAGCLPQNFVSLPTSLVPPRKATMSSLVGLKAISFCEMDSTRDHVLEGFVLTVTIIDIPFKLTGISFVVEDRNRAVQKLAVYGMSGNFPENCDAYGVGTCVSIINPYHRICKDGTTAIRVDDPQTMIVDGKVNERCWCCGAKGDMKQCSACLRAKYCSRECQQDDWERLGHKLYCKYIKTR